MASLAKRSVNVIMLGRMGFIPAFDVQSRYARQHLDEMASKPNARGENTLLLVEHNPVYTVGIRDKDYTQDDVTRLKATGAQFYRTNRGGLITFHGPGQLVAYPILNLTRFKASMRWYVCQLEKTLIETLKPFGVTGRSTDQTGVWVDDRKIASIGLHCTRYVTTHGVALNCNNDLSWFRAINPCGLKGVEMTSLTKELETNISTEDATKPFLRAFQEVFNCDLEYRMLEEEDVNTLHDVNDVNATQNFSKKAVPSSSETTTATTATSSGKDSSVGNSSSSRMDQRLEMGVRQLSTLASSSISSTKSITLSSKPAFKPSQTSSPVFKQSSSLLSTTASFPLSSSDNCHSTLGENKLANDLIPPVIRRIGPMW